MSFRRTKKIKEYVMHDPMGMRHSQKELKPLKEIAWGVQTTMVNIDQIAHFLFDRHGISVALVSRGPLTDHSMLWVMECAYREVKDYDDGILKYRQPQVGDYIVEYTDGDWAIMSKGRYYWHIRHYLEQNDLPHEPINVYNLVNTYADNSKEGLKKTMQELLTEAEEDKDDITNNDRQ